MNTLLYNIASDVPSYRLFASSLRRSHMMMRASMQQYMQVCNSASAAARRRVTVMMRRDVTENVTYDDNDHRDRSIVSRGDDRSVRIFSGNPRNPESGIVEFQSGNPSQTLFSLPPLPGGSLRSGGTPVGLFTDSRWCSGARRVNWGISFGS